VSERSGSFYLDSDQQPGQYEFEYKSRADGKYKFGFSSDQHIASKYSRIDVLEDLYDKFAEQKVDRVINCGNWIDGEARFNKHDLLYHGLDNQISALVNLYPHRAGIKTYAVAGDDHEGWACFAGNSAEIFTLEKGWVRFCDLDGSEHAASKSDSGYWLWQKIRKVIRKPHDGNVIRLKHRSIDVTVTPDHRFEVIRKPSMHGDGIVVNMTAEEIYAQFKPRCIGIPRTCNGGNDFAPCDHIADINDKANQNKLPPASTPENLARLCGWFASEGWTSGNVVCIGQSFSVNSDKSVAIASLLDEMGYSVSIADNCVRFTCKSTAEYLRKNCGEGFANKKLPWWILASGHSVHEAAFFAAIAGDGHDRGDGCGWKYYSGSKAMIDCMTELCQKLGYTCSFYEDTRDSGCTNMHIGEVHDTAFLFARPTIEKYTGDVWCVSVDSGRIFVRDNGKSFWSLNCQDSGVDIGKYAENAFIESGRNDWIDTGYMESYMNLVHRDSGKTSKLLMMHPGGGSAYSFSYRPQKIVESLNGGEKPAVLLIGHYHKLSYNVIRNVHAIQSGTTQDQTPFMRKKGIDAHVGGGICELTQDAKTGAITSCKVEFFCYYNEGYYNNRWSHSGSVTHPKRGLYGRV
jgi:predicted phosphodiesterase